MHICLSYGKPIMYKKIEGTNVTVVWHSRWKNINKSETEFERERYFHHRFRQFWEQKEEEEEKEKNLK